MRRRAGLAFLLPVALYLVVTAAMVQMGDRLTRGEFTYSVDDAYIHLAIARSLLETGTFCTAGTAFCSASSSPVWPYLVYLWGRLSGPLSWGPLVLNLAGGVLLIAILFRIARDRAGAAGAAVLATVAAATVLVPGMTLIGMEHVWHQATAVLFAWAAVRFLLESRDARARAVLPIAGLACLAAAFRSETLFLVLVVGIFLLARRRVAQPVVLGAVASIPLAFQALQGIVHGEHPLPNSVLVNTLARDANVSFAHDRYFRVVHNLAMSPPIRGLLGLTLLLLLVYVVRRRALGPERFARGATWLGLFLGAAVLHTLLALSGVLFRHEAYLLALGAAAVLVAVSELGISTVPAGVLRRGLVTVAAAAVLWAPLGLTPTKHAMRMVLGGVNIHDQQCQMARFIDRYYRGKAVAINDIGCVSFVARQTRIVDLVGLAHHPILRHRLSEGMSKGYLTQITRQEGLELALIYEPWFGDPGWIPDDWRKIATWEIPHNVVCSYHTVAFFSPDRGLDETIRDQVLSFRNELPPGIRVEIFVPPGP